MGLVGEGVVVGWGRGGDFVYFLVGFCRRSISKSVLLSCSSFGLRRCCFRLFCSFWLFYFGLFWVFIVRRGRILSVGKYGVFRVGGG